MALTSQKTNLMLHNVFANDNKGFNLFYQCLTDFGGQSYCMLEATNVYHIDLADFLYDKGFTVAVINPKNTPNFSFAYARRNCGLITS